MQGRTLRSVPRQLCEAITVRRELVCCRASRRIAATVFKDARHAGNTRGGNTCMGESDASVARQARSGDVDFALIGHQEIWSAAADVIAVLRGPDRTPLPAAELKYIVPRIRPATCGHVALGR